MYDGGKWTGWNQFKERVSAALAGTEDEELDKTKVIVNGKAIADGVLIEGTAYVPLRAVGDALGLQIGWDNKSKTASLTKVE